MPFDFDFDAAIAAPFRMQPGLHRTRSAPLTPLVPGSRHQREKLAVLSSTSHRALVQVEGFDARPALHALCRVAAKAWPEHFAWDGRTAVARSQRLSVSDGKVRVEHGGAFGLGDELPRCVNEQRADQRLAALLALTFAEDMAIVDAQTATVPWMAVCLPSHWAPQLKVGGSFASIHAPVPDSTTLIAAGAAMLRHASQDHAEGAMRRHVWNVTAHPRLNAHPQVVDPMPWRGDEFDDDDAPQAWLRTEQQTFVHTGHAQSVFAIGVNVLPMAQAVDSRARAQRLHDAVASMSAGVLAYRRLDAIRPRLLAWLARRAAA